MHSSLQKLVFMLCAFLASSSVVLAQAGSLDMTFLASDLGLGMGDGADGDVTAAVQQPDGKLIIGGYFKSFHGAPCHALARVNLDGTLDESFQVPLPTGWNSISGISSLAIEPDGKVLVALDYYLPSTPQNILKKNVFRLFPDGSFDPGFDAGTGYGFSLDMLERGRLCG